MSFQNGAGNVETLIEVLGKARVVGGLSYHSAAAIAPGHARHTHHGPTWLGELDGSKTPRVQALSDALQSAGLEPVIVDDIVGYIWTKVILNSAINPICAAMGIRVGEVPRTPGADELQTRIVEEAIAVLTAKGVKLVDPDPMATIKAHCRHKFNKPSMLQHMEHGKETEVDSLNGAIVRMGRALGVPTPYNEALTWMVKGINAASQAGDARPADRLRRIGEGGTSRSVQNKLDCESRPTFGSPHPDPHPTLSRYNFYPPPPPRLRTQGREYQTLESRLLSRGQPGGCSRCRFETRTPDAMRRAASR